MVRIRGVATNSDWKNKKKRVAQVGRTGVDQAQIIPLDSPPLDELPCWGHRVEFDDFFVELVPPGKRLFNVRLANAFASVNFGPAEGTSSLAGDRLRRYDRRPFEHIVVPPRYPLRGATEIAPEVLVFAFDFERLRTPLAQAAGVPVDAVNLQVVIGSPAPLKTAIAKRIRNYMSAKPVSRRYLQSLCVVLLMEMCLPMAGKRGAKRRSPLKIEKLTMLFKYIDANLDSDLGVQSLAQLVGASPDQLSRVFKRSVGDSPHNYVIQRRTDAARELLRDERFTLSQIAYATGFSSQSHMTTAFKKLLGATPGAMRRRVQSAATDTT